MLLNTSLILYILLLLIYLTFSNLKIYMSIRGMWCKIVFYFDYILFTIVIFTFLGDLISSLSYLINNIFDYINIIIYNNII